MDIKVENNRGWLRGVVDHFEADVNVHHCLRFPAGEVAHGRGVGGGTGSHVCYWAQGVNHGALKAAYAVRNVSISMRRT
ncbi:MAG TPA: hypothetical protein VFP27_08855, partial [Mycobacterium sp.]|nr:hypothetical protein [Mycobacterium sp.]